jgi:hypothetical protein
MDVIIRGRVTPANDKRRFLVTFCRLAKSYPLLGAEALALKHQRKQRRWIPAFAGMTSKSRVKAGFQLSL